MEVCRDRQSLREFRSRLEGSVGFVATMGALHKGHLSLIEKSLQENNIYLCESYAIWGE